MVSGKVVGETPHEIVEHPTGQLFFDQRPNAENHREGWSQKSSMKDDIIVSCWGCLCMMVASKVGRSPASRSRYSSVLTKKHRRECLPVSHCQ